MLVVKVFGVAFFAASTVYLLLAVRGLLKFHGQSGRGRWAPPVTVMVPCHGAPLRFAECVTSIMDQSYPGPVQVVFGLHSDDDPARPVLERLMAERPRLDTALVIDDRRIGANPKNCNLSNMMSAVRHEVLVVVDSDVIVRPDFLAVIVEPLRQPGIGASTCMYKGVPETGFASRLGALYTNDWFIPSVLVDVGIHGLGVTYGAAAALRRETLERIGGFEAMADAVAQDFVLGHEVRRLGLSIVLAPMVVSTIVSENSIKTLHVRELRWMRAIRAVRPLDHLLWIASSGLVPLLAFAPLFPLKLAAAALASHAGLRLAIHLLVRRRVALPPPEPLLLPLREVANFILWVRSLLGRRVQWAGAELITGTGLAMHPAQVSKKPH